MRFHESITPEDHARVLQAIESIKKYGDTQHAETAGFLETCDALLFIGPANEVGGSGSVGIYESEAANKAIRKGNLSLHEASRFIRMNLARETIDGGGQRGIEGTFVHEGKHLRDFAMMIATFSGEDKCKYFDPTAFQLELSAHITASFYLLRRGGEFAQEGLQLGVLEERDGRVVLSDRGIRERLRNGYGLSEETPGPRASERWTPVIESRKLSGISG
jgi:hypothetical protein